MEAFHSKWKNLHQSAKNQATTSTSKNERFRSKSKDKQAFHSHHKNISSIGKLLPNTQGKQKQAANSAIVEYYQLRGKQNSKENAWQDQSNTLKKKLSKLGEAKPQEKQLIDSAILLLNKYQKTIESLQSQNIHLAKQLQQTKADPLHKPHDDFSSQKTVSSQSSNKKLPPANNSCASSYYFSMFSPQQ